VCVALFATLPLLLAGCDLLDQLAGRPVAGETVEQVSQPAISVPSGPHLFCISNIGHTLVVFDLTARQVLLGTRRYLDLDPVGPWFSGGFGYYISRVESSGAGSNALVEFHPKTAVERRRMIFPANSNPTTMLLLPAQPGMAWVALRGSTFDNFATNGIAVVDLEAWSFDFKDLNDLAGTTDLTSLSSLAWDAACPSQFSGPCVYALVNNFNGAVRDGWLLVLGVAENGLPTLLDAVALGRNPQEDMLLDSANQRLWVVNNGGYPPGHQPGEIWGLYTTDFSAAPVTIPEGTLPSGTEALVGIHGFDAATAWVTTYPADAVFTLSLNSPFTFTAAPGLPTLTGPLFHTTAPVPGLYAGKGGFSTAHLAELNPATGALLADHSLQSGNGPVSCAEYSVP
jgi:hypothetical protein